MDIRDAIQNMISRAPELALTLLIILILAGIVTAIQIIRDDINYNRNRRRNKRNKRR